MVMSVRGIARRFLNLTGDLSLRDLTNGIAAPPANGGVRGRLTGAAREHVRFTRRECIYTIPVSYEQVWSAVTVRIQLVPDDGITAENLSTLRQSWEAAIESRWSEVWAIASGPEGPCAITVDVQWVSSNADQVVRVRPGPAQTNQRTWDTADSGPVASHEFGHMLGNPDEYPSPTCPDRNPVNSGTIMDMKNANVIPARLLQNIASRVGSSLTGI